MKDHKRLWAVVGGVAALIAGHGVIFYYAASNLALSSAVIASMVAVVVLKHLGLMGPLYGIWRKTRRRS